MAESRGRRDTRQILEGIVQRLDPRKLVTGSLGLSDGVLSIDSGVSWPVTSGRVVVLAVGKASVPMATGALDVLGEHASRAIAVTKSSLPLAVDPPGQLELIESDHPVPTERSLEAGRRLLDAVQDLGQDDLVVMLISGGGSALIEDLLEGVTLDDLRASTDHLLRAGATINEMNAVRRRLSRIKGGRLARAIAPASVLNLIVSDVLGSPLQDIASGPTVRPPENDQTFQSVLQRADLINGLPASVQHQLTAMEGAEAPWPDNVLGTSVLADAEAAARVAAELASGLGYSTQTLGFDFQGEAREFGRIWATIARHARTDRTAFQLPLALIGSGELTVTVRGDGAGGRNTEMALAAAQEIAGLDGITITSFATDGDDGVSGCAGGTVDAETIDRISEAGRDPGTRLQENDSATALAAGEATIDIGSTGTNVNDVYLALIRDTE